MDVSTERWRSLEAWSPTLFLVAGVILVGYATVNGVSAFTDLTIEQDIFEFGYVLGFLGLLGVYPRLADRSPKLARAGAVAALLGLIAFIGVTLTNVGYAMGVLSTERPAWYPVVIVFGVAGFVPGFLLFGVASLRTGAHPRIVGVLLLVPGIIIALMLVHIYAGLDSPVTVFVVSAGQAMSHLAIGTTLETASESTEQAEAEPTPEMPAQD
jgi:hypothetical protein